MTDAEHFEKHGCVLVKNFIDEKTISVVSQYFENKIRRGEWTEVSDKGDPTSRFAYYADPLIEIILQTSKEAVEDATGKELMPTYSYSRIYQAGERLYPHVDRPACEISVTVNVATKGEFSPIYTQYGQNDPEKHVLNPGDAVIYMGCDVMHWRQPLKEDQLNVQFMLHYVDKNGPNAEYAKDKRAAYGLDSKSRSQ
jgi:hypothetical protein